MASAAPPLGAGCVAASPPRPGGGDRVLGDRPLAEGPRRLAWEVTYRPYRENAADQLAPYPLEGQEEEPVAAGVVTTLAMERRAPADPPANFRRTASRSACKKPMIPALSSGHRSPSMGSTGIAPRIFSTASSDENHACAPSMESAEISPIWQAFT